MCLMCFKANVQRCDSCTEQFFVVLHTALLVVPFGNPQVNLLWGAFMALLCHFPQHKQHHHFCFSSPRTPEGSSTALHNSKAEGLSRDWGALVFHTQAQNSLFPSPPPAAVFLWALQLPSLSLSLSLAAKGRGLRQAGYSGALQGCGSLQKHPVMGGGGRPALGSGRHHLSQADMQRHA